MIRPYQPADQAALVALVTECDLTPAPLIAERLEPGKALVYAHEGAPVAAAAWRTAPVEGGLRFRCWLFTAPAHRGRGIGRALWEALLEQARLAGATELVTDYQVSGSHADRFFPARGFTDWVAVDLMGYSGPDFPEPELVAVPYEDRYFERWLTLMNEGFYPIRQMSDVRPYNIYSEAAFQDPELRKELLGRSEDRFLVLQGEQLVGLLKLSGQQIQAVVVAAGAQGQGLGRKLVQFAVNRLRERGVAQPLLDVGQPNLRAVALYRSLGFERLQTNQIVRKSVEP